MATNDFLPFAIGPGANVEAQAPYIADPMRSAGNQRGIAISSVTNKALRQGTFPTAAVSQFICDVLNENVSDNGDLAFYEDQLKRALTAWIRSIINCAYIHTCVDCAYIYSCVTPAYIKGIVDAPYIYSIVTCSYIYSCVTPAYIKGIVDCIYIQSCVPCTYVQGCVPPSYIKGIIDCAYIQSCVPAGQVVDCAFIYSCVTPAYIESIITCDYIWACVEPRLPTVGPGTGGPFIHTFRTVTDVGYPPSSESDHSGGDSTPATVNILTSDWYVMWDPPLPPGNNDYQIIFNLPSATAGQQIIIKTGIGRDTSSSFHASIWQAIIRAPGGSIGMIDGNSGIVYGQFKDNEINGTFAASCNGVQFTFTCRGGSNWL